MNSFGILIHIRLESSRLPEKHIKLANNKYLIEHQIIRIKDKMNPKDSNIKIILNVSEVSKDKYFDILKSIADKHNVELFFGDNDNIPLRIYQCSKKHNLTHIISVDGDDILVSSQQILNIYNYFTNSSEYNLLYTLNLPLGMNVFGFTHKVLEENYLNEVKSYEVGWPCIFNFDLVNIDEKDKVNIIETKDVRMLEINTGYKQNNFYDKLRFTLDYIEDYNLVKEILNNISSTSSDEEIINYVCENELFNINIKNIEKWYDNFIKGKENN